MSSSDTVLSVSGVSKKFCKNLRRSMAYGIGELGMNLVGMRPRLDVLRKDEFWALSDINFELKKGEVLGLIGKNGSGKTTLLRILSGIFPPDTGEIRVNGRISALISLGAGFHQHMSGHENIFLNGSILGMTQAEIAGAYDEIVEFSELRDFINAPVASYSSGMRVRLGFAIATAINPDILVIDEVLAVGDISFRNKCLRRMKRLREAGKAVIFVSHNMEHIHYICEKAILLDHGRITEEGPSDETIRTYERTVLLKGDDRDIPAQSLGMGVEIESVSFNGQETGEQPASVEQDQKLKIELVVKIDQEFKNCSPILASATEDGLPVWLVNAHEQGLPAQDYAPGRYEFTIELPCLNLREGRYHLHFAFRNLDTFETFEKQANVATFLVIGSRQRQRAEFILAPKVECQMKELDRSSAPSL